ncbi:NADP-dependent oxidoreductase domain containing protein [Elaphomyces granulatus]
MQVQRSHLKRESGIPRDELFIVTKLHDWFHNPKDVEINMNMSLGNFKLDYVDLYLMHFPYAYATTEGYRTQRTADGKPLLDIPLSKAYDVTWAAMEKLVEQGKTRLIGVSNFSSPKLKRLLKTAKIHPVVNQVEIHPYFPQKGLVEYCQANEIHRRSPGPLEDPTILELAKQYKKTAAQLILCHSICRGISVIDPKSNNPKRVIIENFDVLFELSEADFKTIDDLMGERGVRNLEPKDYLGFDNFNEAIEEP